MTVTKDTNLGTLFPIIAFLVIQSGGAIWWASQMTSEVKLLRSDVTDFSEALAGEKGERIEDRRRIYDRIVQNDKVIAEIIANERATEAVLLSVKTDVAQLRNEIAQNNELIRQLLINLGGRADGRPTGN